MQFNPIDLLQCPRCGGDLLSRTGSLSCVRCGETIPYVNGIIDFVKDSARTMLDDIDYDAFYRINEQAAQRLIGGMMQCAGERWPQSLGTAIEIGAGTGGATMGLATLSAFRHLVVTDISLKMLGLCQRNLAEAGVLYQDNMTFVTYGATQNCFRPGSFDTCISSAVLHHITDVESFLTDLTRMLKPRGCAFFVEPSLPFHQALVSTLGDIVTGMIAEDVPYDNTDVCRMCNWMAETRCNLLHQEDLEFLSTREDKHMFVPEKIEALGRSAGFEQVAALEYGRDPLGEQTLRTYLTQVEISERMIERVCAALPEYHSRHMAKLRPGDQAASYLLYFSKTPSSCWPTLSRYAKQAASYLLCFSKTPAVQDSAGIQTTKESGLDTRFHLITQAIENNTQTAVSIEGWCLSRLDVAWVVAEIAGNAKKFPVWLPRPDVQSIINSRHEFPPLNALCSGVSGQLSVGSLSGAMIVRLSAVTTDGKEIPLGQVELTRDNSQGAISQ